MGLSNFFKTIFKKEHVDQTGQLFFIGNKRSGTTILAEKINLHPDIYITHETDIIWILYQLYNGIDFEYYAMDEPHSTIVTREKCEHILNQFSQMPPMECYQKCQQYLMENGTEWRAPVNKKVLVIGDKKPNQHSEPQVNDWLVKNFPQTKYVHIIRHPFDFLHSVPRLPAQFDLGARYGSPKCADPVKILEAWAYFEDLALEEKKKKRFAIHTLKFEDFCKNPAKSLSDIWTFIDVDIPSDLQNRINENDMFGIIPGGLHKNSQGNVYSGFVPERVRALADLYGYDI